MTSQAAEGPETAVASRRSKLTPEREQEFFDAVLEQIRECGYDSVTMEGVAASTRCSPKQLRSLILEPPALKSCSVVCTPDHVS